MAYVAVSGGEEAIATSIQLLDYYRSGTEKDLELEAIAEKFSLLVDKVMSESGLYAKQYAALALKQCEGSAEEAVFLLRAYRSTLKRSHYTNTVTTDEMRVVRRQPSRTYPAVRCWAQLMITPIVSFTLNGRMRMPANCTACFSTSWKNRYRQRQRHITVFQICCVQRA